MFVSLLLQLLLSISWAEDKITCYVYSPVLQCRLRHRHGNGLMAVEASAQVSKVGTGRKELQD